MKKKIKDPFKRTNRIKVVRSIFEGIFLIVLLFVIIRALVSFKTFQPYDETETKMSNKGFIALSYFGVDRSGTQTLISTERLRQHLEALKANGYVTITQQDIIDYYTKGKQLPENSLFLMVEDGRSETAIFAQDIMEELNYIGTMFSYAKNLKSHDNRFLQAKDLKEIYDSGWWELGTNGYRLSFINVFDRYDNFLGNLNSLEFSRNAKYLGRNYNHYLMDYKRDEYDIPIESYSELENRISADYAKINEIFKEDVKVLPRVYCLMHSNTNAFGTNANASDINERNIKQQFAMNFNREGQCLNTRENSIYDLTRIQPQAYWSTNHLLMRIKEDTHENLTFVTGNGKNKSKWEQITGASEFENEKIILTSEPSKEGTIRLNDQKTYQDVAVNVQLTGNKIGIQSIYLRASDDLSNYVKVELNRNVLYVKESANGVKKNLYELNLDEFDGVKYLSKEEDERQCLIGENKTVLKYSNSSKELADAKKKINELEAKEIVETKDDLYIPEISLSAAGNRTLKIQC